MVRTLWMLASSTKKIVAEFLLSIVEDIGRGANSTLDLSLGGIKSEVGFAEKRLSSLRTEERWRR
jgi:hypothetical protein